MTLSFVCAVGVPGVVYYEVNSRLLSFQCDAMRCRRNESATRGHDERGAGDADGDVESAEATEALTEAEQSLEACA